LGLLILIGKAFKRFEDGAQTAAKILLAHWRWWPSSGRSTSSRSCWPARSRSGCWS
jgi:hypothetical protein